MVAVTIRPLTPADAPSVRECFATLSPRTLYRRYGRAAISEDDALRWVAELDGRRSFALAARAPGSDVNLGVARYVVEAQGRAELAVTVGDAWQGQGIGRALVDALIPLAAARGIRRLHAYIMVDNRPAIRLMSAAGGRRLGPSTGGVVEFETGELGAAAVNWSADA